MTKADPRLSLDQQAIARGMRASRQAISVSGLELQLARESRIHGEEALAALEGTMAQVERAIRCQMEVSERSWDAAKTALLSLAETEAPTTANGAAIELAAALGLSEWLPFVKSADFRQFVDDENATLRLGDVDLSAGATRPSDKLLSSIGTRTVSPAPLQKEDAVRKMVADRSVLAVAPSAGMHVSVSRKSPTRHHGVLLGDGTVAHFQKADWSPYSSVTTRTSVAEFLKESDPASLMRHFPERRRASAPAPVFMPNLVALRAIRGLDNGGYQILRNNCEHFGTWAQCGAMLSRQADRVWRAGQLANIGAAGDSARLTAPAVSIAMAFYLQCWTMTVGSARWVGAPFSREPTAGPDLFDVGRVRWAADTNELLWWLPIWTSDGPVRTGELPFGPRDRSWGAGTPNPETVWHSTPPSIEIDRDWHASLLLDPEWNLWIVDVDGRWWKADFDLDEVIDKRVAGIEELNRALARRDDVFETNEVGDQPQLPAELAAFALESLEPQGGDRPRLPAGPLID